jgi:hypothetical protein
MNRKFKTKKKNIQESREMELSLSKKKLPPKEKYKNSKIWLDDETMEEFQTDFFRAEVRKKTDHQ